VASGKAFAPRFTHTRSTHSQTEICYLDHFPLSHRRCQANPTIEQDAAVWNMFEISCLLIYPQAEDGRVLDRWGARARTGAIPFQEGGWCSPNLEWHEGDFRGEVGKTGKGKRVLQGRERAHPRVTKIESMHVSLSRERVKEGE